MRVRNSCPRPANPSVMAVGHDTSPYTGEVLARCSVFLRTSLLPEPLARWCEGYARAFAPRPGAAGNRKRSRICKLRTLVLNLLHHEALEDVALFDVVELFDAHAALVAGGDLLDGVLEALERAEHTFVDDHVVTQHAQVILPSLT